MVMVMWMWMFGMEAKSCVNNVCDCDCEDTSCLGGRRACLSVFFSQFPFPHAIIVGHVTMYLHNNVDRPTSRNQRGTKSPYSLITNSFILAN